MTMSRRAPWVAFIAALLLALSPAARPALAQRGAPPTFATIVETVAPAVVTISAVVDPKAAGAERDDEEPAEAAHGSEPASSSIPGRRADQCARRRRRHGDRGRVTSDGRRSRPTRTMIDARSDLAVLVIGDGAMTFPFARLADSDQRSRGRLGRGDRHASRAADDGDRRHHQRARWRRHRSPRAGYLQTSAVLRLGSSGGPLVDLDGEVVGVDTVSRSRSAGPWVHRPLQHGAGDGRSS